MSIRYIFRNNHPVIRQMQTVAELEAAGLPVPFTCDRLILSETGVVTCPEAYDRYIATLNL